MTFTYIYIFYFGVFILKLNGNDLITGAGKGSTLTFLWKSMDHKRNNIHCSLVYKCRG